MKTVSLKLPDALRRKLERAARERRQSKSDVIRSALEQYLNGERPAGRGSFLEAAADLIGCVEGPGDLSYNPNHMEGFGR
jgi:Arc/MetJ-type ribon-helix-helix transcriptional regulator